MRKLLMAKNILKNKNILIGITGGIAAYKVNLLIRELKKNDAQVKVILTKSGKEFVSELTLETLSKNRVYSELFEKKYDMIDSLVKSLKD